MSDWYPKITPFHNMYIPSQDTAMHINDSNFFQVNPTMPMNQAEFSVFTDKQHDIHSESNGESIRLGQTMRYPMEYIWNSINGW